MVKSKFSNHYISLGIPLMENPTETISRVIIRVRNCGKNPERKMKRRDFPTKYGDLIHSGLI